MVKFGFDLKQPLNFLWIVRQNILLYSFNELHRNCLEIQLQSIEIIMNLNYIALSDVTVVRVTYRCS